MAIQRDNLIFAIISAYKNQDFDIYNELLKLYYKLLSQEDINDHYIEEFTSYDEISSEALQLLNKAG